MNEIKDFQNEITDLIFKYAANKIYSEMIDVLVGNGVMLAGAILYDLDKTDRIEKYICKVVNEYSNHTKCLIKEIESS